MDVGRYRSNYDGELKKIICFGFPRDKLEWDA